MRKRAKTFSVRLSDKEFENLEKAIKKCNITKSEFVRKIANRYLPKERPPDEYNKFIMLLTEIGNELYRILSMAKSTGKVDVEKLEEQVKKIDEAILIINKFYTIPEKIKLTGSDIQWLQQKYGT